MLAFIFSRLGLYVSHPLGWLFIAFIAWMVVDAVRREEWWWVAFLLLFPELNGILYFFMIYRGAPSLPSRGFVLPGQADRERIAELEKQIQLLDKAHHHSELGDVYFQQSKLKEAEACYLRALERDPKDIDTRAHLGQCLLWLGRATEARGYLEDVCVENPKHDYGNSLMALAEARAALGDTDGAIAVWEQVVAQHSHARARVQLAELLAAQGQSDRARQLAGEVISEDKIAPAYQRKQEQPWVARAKKLAKALAK